MKLARRALACSAIALTALACGARGSLDDYGSVTTNGDGGSSTSNTPAPGNTATPGTPGTPGSPGTLDDGGPGTSTTDGGITLPNLPPGSPIAASWPAARASPRTAARRLRRAWPTRRARPSSSASRPTASAARSVGSVWEGAAGAAAAGRGAVRAASRRAPPEESRGLEPAPHPHLPHRLVRHVVRVLAGRTRWTRRARRARPRPRIRGAHERRSPPAERGEAHLLGVPADLRREVTLASRAP